MIETADRFNLSATVVAHIANDIRTEDGFITEENQSKVLYTRKVHRIRKKVRVEKVEAMKDKTVEGIMFDERIDKTRKEVGTGKSNHKRFRIQKEEHCSVVGYSSHFQGGSAFLGHLVPQEGTGKGLAASLISFTESKRIKLDSPLTQFTDGCSKMGGYKGGAQACLEEELGEATQRVFCLNHSIQRPVAKLFEHYDGKTTGPDSWSGEIGKVIITEVSQLPVVAFEPVTNLELSEAINALAQEDLKSLCHDLRYLIEMGRGVTSGHLDQCWRDMQPGTCAEIRWTNPQSRTLHLYMSSENPSFSLRRMVNYIIMVYLLTVLSVRMEDNIVAASKHFLKNVILVEKYCLEEESLSCIPSCSSMPIWPTLKMSSSRW